MLRFRALALNLIIFSVLILVLTSCASQQTGSKPSQPQNGQNPPLISPEAEAETMPEEAIYVSLITMNQVAVLDSATGEIVKEIPVGAKPAALVKSPDNRYVFVANSGSGDVYMINTSTGEIDAKVSMGVQPVAMTMNTAGDKLYVVDYYLNRVSALDVKLRSMTEFYELNRLGYDDRSEPLACCRDIFGEPVGEGRSPSTIALDEDAEKIYVGNLGTWDVAVLDMVAGKEIATFDAAAGINKMFISSQDHLYLSAAGNDLENNETIIVLDLKGGEIKDRIEVGEKPVSMALTSDRKTVYVVTKDDAKLSGISLATGEIISSCSIGGEPGDIVLSEDGKKAYITDSLAGTITIVDLDAYSVLNTIDVGITPKSLVFIEKN